MNRENIQKWIDALRSGDFKQGYGALCRWSVASTHKEYCCLGVACEISQLGEWKPRSTAFSYDVGSDFQGAILPPEVAKWLGLDDRDPVLYQDDEDDYDMRCTVVNDSVEASFSDIADMLEKRYLNG